MSDFRLKVFYIAAKNLSFTKAAKELFVSQPAITKHIQELETAYQARLFDRTGNKLALTPAGKLLLSHCETILSDYRKLEYEMHLLNNEYTGELRLGASTTIAQYFLPQILAEFTNRYPNLHLSMTSANTQAIEHALLCHDIDLGLVEGIVRLPELKYEPLLKDELVAVVHKSNRLPVGDEITVEQLKEIPLVLRERGSGTLDVIESALKTWNLKLSAMNVRLFLGGTESIKSFLKYSNSMGIVSFLSIAEEVANGEFRIIDINGLEITRHFCIVHRHGHDNPHINKFVQYVRQYLQRKKKEGDIIGQMAIDLE